MELYWYSLVKIVVLRSGSGLLCEVLLSTTLQHKRKLSAGLSYASLNLYRHSVNLSSLWVSFCVSMSNSIHGVSSILFNHIMGILISIQLSFNTYFHTVSRLHMHKKHHSCTKTHLESSNKEHLCDALVDKWGQGIVLMKFFASDQFQGVAHL